MSKNKDYKSLQKINESIFGIVKNQDIDTSIKSLAYVLTFLWCQRQYIETVTQSIDDWRIFNIEIENAIRMMFGPLRYGDQDARPE